ncbi:MAG: NAD-dependent epimerase/dehydratase family protein [Elusimicrobiota bacterium]|jgi:nucleoside-diphosphate-sugar epimerase
MRVLVTGGGGFLGSAVARRLQFRGHSVTSFSRRRYPELEAEGIACAVGDLADARAVAEACSGRDAVVHVAAKVGLGGAYADFQRSNVVGTANVIRACQDLRVPRLVFTSSPSVVFDGQDVEGVDERAPYPRRFDSCYSQTKAVAEEMVLSADSPSLATVAIRPHLVWGPGHNHIVSRIVAQGRAGQLRRIIGHNKRVDATYIDDAAAAHLLALEKLAPGSPIAGKAYFISAGDPRPIWEIVDGILKAAGLPPVSKCVPRPAAQAAAWAMESFYRLARRSDEPRLTRFLVNQLCTAHWFDISAARRDLGYKPAVALEDGLERLRVWLSAGGKL